jgi:hypothetical protein
LQSWYLTSSEAKITQPDYSDLSSHLPSQISDTAVQTDALDIGELNTIDGGPLDDTIGGIGVKKDREDSISDLLFLYNITFLSDSKVSLGSF